MAAIEWGPAVGFLAGGLGLGALILWRLTPKAAQPTHGSSAAEPLARRDLQARFDALVAQLRELEDTAGKRTLTQLASERRELELAAAKVLIALDEMPLAATSAPVPTEESTADSSEQPIPASAPEARAQGSSLTGFFWGIGSAAALGLLFYLVSQSAQERAPNGSVTGNTPMDAQPAPQSAIGGEPGMGATAGTELPDDPELAALTQRVSQNPDDLAARLDLARYHLMREDLMAVFNETQQILQRDANNPRALSYQALVRLAMGQVELAEQMLTRALQGDPGLIEGYINLMMVYTTTGRMQEADTLLAHATQRFPERADSLRQLLGEMKSRSAARSGTAAMAEDPHAGVALPSAATATNTATPTPTSTASAPATEDASAGSSVAGMIELGPASSAALAPGAVVFVTLRAPGVTVGAPLAARRLMVSSFPLAFEIGQADSMTGAQIPDSVLIEIRLDTDGDLATRPRSDPYGRAENVRLGTRNLRVILAPRGAE